MVECIAKSSKGAGGERPGCSRDAFGSPRAAPTSRLQRPPETRQAPAPPHSTITSGARHSRNTVVTLHGEVQSCLPRLDMFDHALLSCFHISLSAAYCHSLAHLILLVLPCPLGTSPLQADAANFCANLLNLPFTPRCGATRCSPV
jgi:hypothetical protein